MGRGSISRGQIFAQNLQAGSVTLTLGGTGTDTTSVTFARAMKGIPVVVPGVNTNKEVIANAHTITRTGFTLVAMTTSVVTGACAVGYIAYDDQYN